MNLPLKPLTYATRDEIDLTLEVLEGALPDDLSGHVYLNSPCGTVNSGGTPIPKTLPDGTVNPEWGEMMFNGDGMLFHFDCSRSGAIRVTSGLLKTPDYWVDWATRMGAGSEWESLGFRGMGMARTSMTLGSRNQINTSVNLVKWPGDRSTRVTANFDAGRPFEIDPVTLQAVTPIGTNAEWKGELPALLNQLFPLHQSTAHPSFDPLTHEFFTVNFLKDFQTLIFAEKFHPDWLKTPEFLLDELEKLGAHLAGKGLKGRDFLAMMDQFLHYLGAKHSGERIDTFVHGETYGEARDILGMEDEVVLLRWTGSGDLDRWNVVDVETGKNLVIEQTMHQTALSKDWIILVDTSLKFALDVLENNPFPSMPWLNAALRQLTARTIQPVTPIYFVRRADLKVGGGSVTATKAWIDLETVHFSVDYENPGDVVRVYTSHNAALCAAEWIRPYDTLACDPGKPVHENTIGLMVAGEMDLGRVGRFSFHAPTARIVDQKVVHLRDDQPNPHGPQGLHTWAVGLNTYRDQNSADTVTRTIPSIFWQFYGLDRRMLTQFIEGLYAQYQNRIVPVDQIKAKAKVGVPFCLSRQDTESQNFVDGWVFRMNENLRSLQFIPRRTPSAGISADCDGYILCTMINGPEDLKDDLYRREVWLFDANRLSAGPVARLGHPDLAYGFTIHSVWSPDAAPWQGGYQVDVKADCQTTLDALTDPAKKGLFSRILESTVYPHYES